MRSLRWTPSRPSASPRCPSLRPCWPCCSTIPNATASTCRQLRNVSYGAAAMPRDLLRRVLAEWPACGSAQGYGMTELSGNAVFLSPEDHRRAATDDPSLADRCRSARADDVTADRRRRWRRRDPVSDRARSSCAAIRCAPATARTLIRPPRRSPTAGCAPATSVGSTTRGYLHVVDRKKDIIITGGENVSSREVEDVVGTHPAVRRGGGGRRARPTLGRDWSPPWSCRPTRMSRRRSTTCAECRSHLAGFKHPRRVITVELLPTNASGKVDKVALRAIVAGTDPA